MTDVVTKVSIGGQVVPFGGGGSEGQEVVYLTQAEYDALSASKLTDGKIYKIKTSGVAPTPTPSSIDSFNRFITNQPLATYTTDTTISEENIPEGASFFCGAHFTGNVYEMGGIIPLALLKDNPNTTYRFCEDRMQPNVQYSSGSYVIHPGAKIYLF